MLDLHVIAVSRYKQLIPRSLVRAQHGPLPESRIPLRRDVLVAPDRHRFEAGVCTEPAEKATDVVAHGLGAEMQLRGDLLGGPSALQKVEDLRLSWRRAGMRR